MTTIYDIFWLPFQEYSFLRRALAGCFVLSWGCGPIGVFLVLRRMTLMGDALVHSLLPGVAVGFFLKGLSPLAMGIGGVVAGLIVSFAAGLTARYTILQEETSFSGFYLISSALGMVLLSVYGSQIDLIHVLLGTILSISQPVLWGLTAISTLTLLVLSYFYRPLVLECFDPLFFRSVGGSGIFIHGLFLFLTTLNLVAAFQALGTLMALGLMVLPAICARLLAKQVWSLCLISVWISLMASYLGILLSFHFSLPSGPMIVLVTGIFYLIILIRVWICKSFRMIGLVWLLGAGLAYSKPPLSVVASFSIVKDLIHNIAGDQVHIETIVGPNGDVHIYEPKPQNLKVLQKADIVFVNGLGLEHWMDRLIASSGFQGPVVVCSDGVKPRMVPPKGLQSIPDPHAWHDIKNARIYIRNIYEALAKKEPLYSGIFQKRWQVYDQKLIHLEAWVHEALANLPVNNRILVTSHDAFGYFGKAYNMFLMAPIGLSTEIEPSAKTVSELIQNAKKYSVRTVFLENTINPSLIQQIANDAGLNLGGILYTDALSEVDGPAPTYIDMMHHNVNTMIKGLQ